MKNIWLWFKEGAMQLSHNKPMIVKILVEITISYFICNPNFTSIEIELHTPHNRSQRGKA